MAPMYDVTLPTGRIVKKAVNELHWSIYVTKFFFFAYLGPDGWTGDCNTGTQQSPIDIDRNDILHLNNYMPFHFYGYDHRAVVMDYSNSKLSVHVKVGRSENHMNDPYVRVVFLK
jgi:carbonic anhydrase